MNEIIRVECGYMGITDEGAAIFERFVDALAFVDYAAWARSYAGI